MLDSRFCVPVLSLFVAVLWSSLFSCLTFADSRPPNVIVFLVDDMGIMDTSLPFLTDENGNVKRFPLNDFYRTPNMERLAAQGVRFNNFCAMSVCSPTRISIMTGQNAARHHSTNWINPDSDNRGPQGPPSWNWQGLRKNDVTLPGVLQSAGYRTIHVGKGHFGPRAFEGADPLNLGFDSNVAGCSIGAPASYYGNMNYGNGAKKKASHAVPHLEKYHGTDTFLSEALTIEANSLLSEAVHDQKPFYLYFAHYAVHGPHQSDPRFADHYIDSGKSKQAQAFATLIEGMDKSLGDLLARLDELGVAENTLVLFLGDNGTDAPLGDPHAVACAAPLRGKKGSHYEGGMRVPFIAAWAKPSSENENQKQWPIPAGKIQSQIASVCDLFPTITSIANVTPPPKHPVDGHSLAKLMTGETDASRPSRFLMHYPHGPHRSNYFTTFRDGDWKVVYHYVPSPASRNSHYQLFNLARDPFESNDLADAEPEKLVEMVRLLTAELERLNGQYPIDKTDKKTQLRPTVPELSLVE